MKTDVTKFLSYTSVQKKQTQSKKELCIKRTIKRSPHKEKRESGYFKKATNKNSPLTKKFHKIFHQPFFSSYLTSKSHISKCKQRAVYDIVGVFYFSFSRKSKSSFISTTLDSSVVRLELILRHFFLPGVLFQSGFQPHPPTNFLFTLS